MQKGALVSGRHHHNINTIINDKLIDTLTVTNVSREDDGVLWLSGNIVSITVTGAVHNYIYCIVYITVYIYCSTYV